MPRAEATGGPSSAPQILTHLPEPDQELQQVESVGGGIFSTQRCNARCGLRSVGRTSREWLLDRLAIFITKGAEVAAAAELSNSVWAYMGGLGHPGEAALGAFESRWSLAWWIGRRELCRIHAWSLHFSSPNRGLLELFNEANPSLFRLSEGNSQDISNTVASVDLGLLIKAIPGRRQRALSSRREGFSARRHEDAVDARLMQHDFDPDSKLVDVVFPDYVDPTDETARLEQNEKTQVSTFR